MNTKEALKLSIQIEQLKKENRELRQSVRLVDFTADELEFAIDLFCEKQAEAQYYIEKHEGIGTEPPAEYKQTVDRAQLFATQFMDAKAKVIAREIVTTSN